MKLSKRRAEDGAQAAFSDAVREHGRAMFRAARAVLNCDADAEDAVGEAVLRAWRSYGGLREPGAMRAWLIKITVNCAREQRRKTARIICMEDMEAYGGVSEAAEPTGLWEAVLRLPAEQRAAVSLFYYEDMTVEEIAGILGTARGTVKSRLSRARKKLKELLREEGEEWER